MNAFFLLTLAAAVSMLIIPLAWRVAPHLGMMDVPDARKVHASAVPRVGGWGITIGSLVPLLLLFDFDPILQSFVFGATVLFAFGLWDDARQIDHWKKFAGQIIATAIVVYYGDLYVSRLPFIDPWVLSPELGKPLTMFALIGMINAINHSDGLDGLAGGETMISLIVMAFLGYVVDSALVVGIALTTIGGTFGFLRHNTHPARVFMGDAGSQVLGFTLGFLAVYLTQVAHPALSAALPLLLLGLPIADILGVLFQRVSGGMHWFRASRNHIHHRLLDLGFSHFATVVVIYSVQAVLVVGAVVLRYQTDLAVVMTYFAVVGGLFAGLSVAERSGWNRSQLGISGGALTRTAAALGGSDRARAMALACIGLLVPAFMLASSIWVRQVPQDFGLVAAGLALLWGVQIARRRSAESFWVRAAMYVTATFAVYLFLNYPGAGAPIASQVTNAGMIWLAIVIAVFVRFLSEQKFATTPTDYLIVFGLIAITIFDSFDIRAGTTAQFITYAIVLFYGCELMVERIAGRSMVFQWATLAALTVMAVRGLGGPG